MKNLERYCHLSKFQIYFLFVKMRGERVQVHPILQLTVCNVVLNLTHLKKKISIV